MGIEKIIQYVTSSPPKYFGNFTLPVRHESYSISYKHQRSMIYATNAQLGNKYFFIFYDEFKKFQLLTNEIKWRFIKVKKYFFAFIATTLILSGCASGPKTPEEQLNINISDAAIALRDGNDALAAFKISSALESPMAYARINDLFQKNSKAQNIYFHSIEKSISEISSPAHAVTIKLQINNAESARIFPDSQILHLNHLLKKRVQTGNLTGTLPFDLTTDISLFPELMTSEHQNFIINRTIESIQRNEARVLRINALIEYIKIKDKNSIEVKKIESLLPSLKIKYNELDLIGSVFPEYANTRREEVSITISLELKNTDRLLNEDIIQNLKNTISGVTWVSEKSPKSIHVVIERIRSEEKTYPERNETVTYAQHEINWLAAAMLMPRNASYLYDIHSGGAEIEYGYAITGSFDNKIVFDELVRGKVSGTFSKCKNMRIQNVFGGVSPAGFIANPEMQRRCGGPDSVSIEELRNQVLSKISESLLKHQKIKEAHELNF